jgi:hypothetical protein
VLKKLGLNLQGCVDASQLVYVDLFSRPYDANTFDNLPPSQAVPNTTTGKLPKKLLLHSFTEAPSLQPLFTKLGKSLAQLLKQAPPGKHTLVLVDSLNLLLLSAGGDTPLELLEVVNELAAMGDGHPSVALAVGVNRDLVPESQIDWYRSIKQDVFHQVYEVARNLSGYSKDVHG